MNRRTRAALALTAVLALSGCTAPAPDVLPPTSSSPSAVGPDSESKGNPEQQSPDVDQRPVVGVKEFEAEYSNAAESLARSLPPEAEIPQAPPGQWDEDGRFEEGTGGMQAAFAWQCAWLLEYQRAIDQADTNATHAALDQLERWIDLEQVVGNVDDQSRQLWISDFIGPGRAGDPAPLQQIAEGC